MLPAVKAAAALLMLADPPPVPECNVIAPAGLIVGGHAGDRADLAEQRADTVGDVDLVAGRPRS